MGAAPGGVAPSLLSGHAQCMVGLLKELAVALGRAAVGQIAKVVRRKADDWIDVPVSEPPHPLSRADVNHIRAQEQASIAAAKHAAGKQHDPGPCPLCQAVDRTASTVRPGKSGKLPPEGG